MSDYKALMIGEKAPHFQANTTYGTVNFPEDYKGKWVVFFSHPGDFTPVCTTELMTFASMANEFAANNCALLGLSVDSNPSHIDWSRAMEKYQWKNIKNPKITFPIVADDLGTVAKLYGMLMPSASATKTVRTVFFIDPEGTIRAMLLYPLTTGRNMKEIMRLLLALQAYDKTGYATPADWMPGEPQVLPAPQTLAAADQRLGDEKKGAFSCLDWYICFTKGSEQPEVSQTMATQSAKVTDTILAPDVRKIPDMAEIIDMISASGMLAPTPASKTQAGKQNATLPDTVSKNPSVSYNRPEIVKPAVQQAEPARKPDGGIMEQNRLLIDADGGFGNHEYFITRDYPKKGF